MGYFVSEGCALTSKKGIQGPHKKMDGLVDEKVLKDFVGKGKVYEADQSKPAAAKAKEAKAAKAAKKTK